MLTNPGITLLLPLLCWLSVDGQIVGSGEVADSPRYECAADIIFILDESNSIWQNDLNLGKLFISRVIDMFTISRNAYQVGMISYGKEASIRFTLTEFQDKEQLKEHVLTLPRLHGQTTRTDFALRLLLDNFNQVSFGARRRIPKAAILITDGGSTFPTRTKQISDLIHRQHRQLKIFGIGVAKDRNLNETELKMIASDPDSHFFFTVEDWKSLETIKNELVNVTCLTKRTAPPTLPPLTKPTEPPSENRTVTWTCRQTDIMFLPSEATGPTNLNHLGKFIKEVSRSLPLGSRKEEYRLAVQSTRCWDWDGFEFEDPNTRSYIERRVDSWRFQVPNTALEIDEMRRKFRLSESRKPPMRPGERTRKVAVIILDHTSVDFEKAVTQAREAQDEDIEIYVIAVGNHGISAEANAIASLKLRDHIFRVYSYSQLSADNSRVVKELSEALQKCPRELPEKRPRTYLFL